MSAKKLLLRFYVRFTRLLPNWMKSRRAQFIAFGGALFLFIGAIADIGDFLDFVVPGKDPATTEDIKSLQDVTGGKIDDTAAKIETLTGKMDALVNAQNTDLDDAAKSEIDRAITFFESLEDPRIDEATRLMGAAPPEQALKIFAAVTNSVEKSSNVVEAAKAWRALGALAYPIDRSMALNAYERAFDLNPTDVSISFALGGLYQDFGRMDEAISANNRTITLGQEQGELNLAATARLHNGLVFKQLGQLEKAEAAYSDAVKQFETLDDQYNLAIAYWNLGALYEVLPSYFPERQYDPGAPEFYFKKALDIGYRLNSAELVADAHIGLAGVFLDHAQPMRAAEYYARSLGYYDWSNDRESKGRSYMGLSRAAFVLNDQDAARLYINEAILIFAELEQPLMQAVARTRSSLIFLSAGENDIACKEARTASELVEETKFSGSFADEIRVFSQEACSENPNPDNNFRKWTQSEGGRLEPVSGRSNDLGQFDFSSFDDPQVFGEPVQGSDLLPDKVQTERETRSRN